MNAKREVPVSWAAPCIVLCLALAAAHAQDAPPEAEPETLEELPPAEDEPVEMAEAEEAEATLADEAEPMIALDFEAWVPQPTGLEYTPATIRDPASLSTETIGLPYGTDFVGRYRLSYTLPENWGTVRAGYFAHSDGRDAAESNPGDFVFGEIQVNQLYAGFENDGLADSYTAATTTRLRDFRIEYARTAFNTARVDGIWSLGWRRISHFRHMATLYRPLLPDLPAILPPNPDCPQNVCPVLLTQPDTAAVQSDYEGRGVTGGLDVSFNAWRNKLRIESGASLSVLRGEVDSAYSSNTYVFQCAGPADPGERCTAAGQLLNPPYTDFADFPDQIEEATLPILLSSQSISTSSSVVEAYIGFRFRVLGWLDVFGGFRDARYDDVGVELRPRAPTVSVDSFGTIVYSFQDVDEIDRSVTYEGFYGGVGLRFK